MSSFRPSLADITEQITDQVALIRLDLGAHSDRTTVIARFEAIRHFASGGVRMLEEAGDDEPTRASRAVLP